jgi:hypothetical protein
MNRSSHHPALEFMHQMGRGNHALSSVGTMFQNCWFATLKGDWMGSDLQSRIPWSAWKHTKRILPAWSEEVRAEALEAIVHTMDKIKAIVITAGASAFVLPLFGRREAVPGASDGGLSSQMLISEHIVFEKQTCIAS